MKLQYKEATGIEYAPPPNNNANAKKNKQQMAPTPTTPTAALSPEAESVKAKIVAQGDKIRQMKGDKAPQDQLKPEIDELLKLKASFKEITGTEYQAPGAAPKKSKDKKDKSKEQPQAQKQAPKPEAADGKKITRLGLEAKKRRSSE